MTDQRRAANLGCLSRTGSARAAVTQPLGLTVPSISRLSGDGCRRPISADRSSLAQRLFTISSSRSDSWQ